MNTIPDLIPNANLANGLDNKQTIKVHPINLNDIKVTQPFIDPIQSMACTGVESIGDINICHQ
jgi:hypothetical protein